MACYKAFEKQSVCVAVFKCSCAQRKKKELTVESSNYISSYEIRFFCGCGAKQMSTVFKIVNGVLFEFVWLCESSLCVCVTYMLY